MNNRFFLAILINLSTVCLSVPGAALANTNIWSTSSRFHLPTDAAAKFSINAGPTPITSNSTIINYFSDANCTTGTTSPQTITNGSFIFTNPTNLVQANAASIWNVSGQELNISSIQVIPNTGAGGTGQNVFTTTPCFQVTCNTGGNGKCIYTGGTQPVALN